MSCGAPRPRSARGSTDGPLRGSPSGPLGSNPLFASRPCSGRSSNSIPGAGIEPARPCGQRLLRPPRLPFRHPGEGRPAKPRRPDPSGETYPSRARAPRDEPSGRRRLPAGSGSIENGSHHPPAAASLSQSAIEGLRRDNLPTANDLVRHPRPGLPGATARSSKFEATRHRGIALSHGSGRTLLSPFRTVCRVAQESRCSRSSAAEQ